MRILCANVGSTSFKYQIIDMETTTSLVKGGVERIGNSLSAFTHAVPGKPSREGEIDASTHTAAIAHAMDLITDAEVGCLEDLGQLDGVGFKTHSCPRILAFRPDYRRCDNRAGDIYTARTDA